MGRQPTVTASMHYSEPARYLGEPEGPTPPLTTSLRRAAGTLPNAEFVVVANRLPVDRVQTDDGGADWRTSPGGLVTAMEPVLKARAAEPGADEDPTAAWIGWHGAPDEHLPPFVHE